MYNLSIDKYGANELSSTIKLKWHHNNTQHIRLVKQQTLPYTLMPYRYSFDILRQLSN